MATETVSKTREVKFEPTTFSIPAIDNVSLPGFAVQNYMNRVQDVTDGAATVLELLEWSDGLGECGGSPLLNVPNKYRLMRLVTLSLQTLRDDTERLRDWAYDFHTPEGQAKNR